ncbi:hypothetical protein BLNAU_200 [Blattamonas nauphoetae]|uniref:Uncharacterized protein n=1 Tax=Blattamonas nauphoetae TaxID=2049346 RepID=A0ABQ9YMB8_9EUKA|nr:hypothetical protein BLNAU_200 [Blattamonas nauphoetae]
MTDIDFTDFDDINPTTTSSQPAPAAPSSATKRTRQYDSGAGARKQAPKRTSTRDDQVDLIESREPQIQKSQRIHLDLFDDEDQPPRHVQTAPVKGRPKRQIGTVIDTTKDQKAQKERLLNAFASKPKTSVSSSRVGKLQPAESSQFSKPYHSSATSSTSKQPQPTNLVQRKLPKDPSSSDSRDILGDIPSQESQNTPQSISDQQSEHKPDDLMNDLVDMMDSLAGL